MRESLLALLRNHQAVIMKLFRAFQAAPSLIYSLPLLVIGALSGCAQQPQVKSAHLPVKRVVVYRNGVAYFERAGELDGQEVAFELRKDSIGDFLASLAVMERGGSS
ncbi:MAG: hypothetical protein MK135_15135, partial [Polyangiaceae bacterium]|nr:hypothetical protein [Polyangiaceae bacterium]